MSEWVLADERMPAEDRRVLLCYRTLANRRGICLGKWVGVRWRMAGGYYLDREVVTELEAARALTPGPCRPHRSIERGEIRSAKHS